VSERPSKSSAALCLSPLLDPREWPPFVGPKGLPSDLAILGDQAFALYQVNLIFGMGIVGGPFIVGLVAAGLKRRTNRSPERAFWLTCLPCCILLGITVVGARDPFGSAHLTLLPLEMLGLTLLAAMFQWKRVAAAAILVGRLIDFKLRIWLHVHAESCENTPQRTIFDTSLRPGDGEFQPGPMSLQGLYGGAAWINRFLKHKYQTLRRYQATLAPYEPAEPEERRTVHQLRSTTGIQPGIQRCFKDGGESIILNAHTWRGDSGYRKRRPGATDNTR
jgi:hypothetical protein